MKSVDIRNTFIQFFEEHNHKFVKSAPVVPFEDPSLLFTNAGMNQFKNIFLGLEKRDYNRVANTQKCIRVSGKHNDLEEVGKDTYHHTFFEMLGNWSFGDYYKKEAIVWAWELLTDVWNLPKDKLYATVFRDDDEAETLWRTMTDIKKDHVLRYDEKDNFWEMGEIGPCGPCSEIHIDLGPEACDKKHEKGHRCEINGGCARYIELWNLVFIQFNRDESGELKELASKHIDTGMGFERITAVLQGVGSNYETDLFIPIIDKICEMSGHQYSSEESGTPHRVIADHVRALTFAIADGALPSNEGRGYVLRRILRRASRFARKLNMHEPIIYKLVPVIVDVMGEAFPEISEKHQYVSMVIKAEEEGFNQTVDRGIELFDKLIIDLKRSGKSQIPGKDAFKLYDTYGFPLDLTMLMAEENQFTVDTDEFSKEMDAQRQRARKSGKWEYAVDFNYDNWDTVTPGIDSVFCGYDKMETGAEIRKVKREEDVIFLTLSETPFYGESGGQIGDIGEIQGRNFKLQIVNTLKEGERIIHIAKGKLPDGDIDPSVTAVIDKERRTRTARNHTATHLLQAALRSVLGDHVHQTGSYVSPERLRFDLTHFEKISKNELEKIEKIVNSKIMENLDVTPVELSLDDARNEGAMMLFGEKYDEQVRMIKIDDYSKELCGGTHLRMTGEMGSFRIVSEASVASGVRRIEAITGDYAYEHAVKEKEIIESLKEKLNVIPDELVTRVETMITEKKNLEKEIQTMKAEEAQDDIQKIVDSAKSLNGMKIVLSEIKTSDIESLKTTGDILRNSLKSGVGVLATVIHGKVNFLCVVTDDLVKDKKFHAGEIVKKVAAIAGGSGGGRPHLALAGARDAGKIAKALEEAEEIIRGIA
ncbi:MAG: alanine--tRNA ligase [candidate division KSB1 bacterium]|nr:alanine--tRNA ligase [candidate division KSB1 bacterium]